ncbi:MAG: M1 family metallopeptidase [Gemmatimonadetes bacterium]|nr:M1 family metallopeptidase [Gemmatimonadota bacterium]
MVALLQGGTTTPPSRDTVGYWQQQADYRITATLDEGGERLHARGTLRYVNRSPDTLRVLWLHQYLNAFRPGSRWSATDEREGRQRFQRLTDREQGFERFTAPPTVNGRAVQVEYPFAPDSTVARLALPAPMAPRETLFVHFEWDARPSTLPRRQGRRGRTYDFAQWYPKVAVYDRKGWEPNPLVPAGELYGEFGAFDVTLVVREDQVLGATGVVMQGDPGWARVAQGEHRPPAIAVAYEGDRPDAWLDASDSVRVPAGHRIVRWRARSVHHFAWTASPLYKYEGGIWVRPAGAPRMPFRTWDTVAVHVLYKPGDEGAWGNGLALARTRIALSWLEQVYGPYGYPQVTNLHRLDGGGTEFPMMMMNGGADDELIHHEFGHIFTYGILANNEWRSGWMDEGLTSYQTAWALGLVPQARTAGASAPPPRRTGYRALALVPSDEDAAAMDAARLVARGLTQPIGTPAHEFREFALYNLMVYDRASDMYSALRDVVGDSAFTRFLRGYYARWGMKHVDEEAMRAEAERAWGGRDLSWFFAQWVHGTGLVDYSAERADKRRQRDGTWETDVTVRRVGAYQHPVRIGIRTDSGWTVMPLADATVSRQLVTIPTRFEPREVRLDPQGTSGDWRAENDVVAFGDAARPSMDQWNWDWPFLDQRVRGGTLHLHRPALWFTDQGGLALGWSVRESMDGWLSRVRWGVSGPTRTRTAVLSGWAGVDTLGRSAEWQPNLWFEWEDPYVGGAVLAGARAGLAVRDGLARVHLGQTLDLSPFTFAAGARRTLDMDVTAWSARALAYVDPARWSGTDAVEFSARYQARMTDRFAPTWTARGGIGARRGGGPWLRGELTGTVGTRWLGGAQESWLRGYAGWVSSGAPREREVYAGMEAPLETYDLDWYRGAGAPLARRDVGFVPLGGAALRGFAPLALGAVASVTGEHDVRLAQLGGTRPLAISASIFADVGVVLRDGAVAAGTRLADAGVGLVARGAIYDRPVQLRADVPLYVSRPALAVGTSGGTNQIAFRFTFSFSDLW